MLRADLYPWQAARLSGIRSGSLRAGTAHGGIVSLELLFHPLSDNPKRLIGTGTRSMNHVFRAWAKECSAVGRVFFEGEGKGMNFPRRGNRG